MPLKEVLIPNIIKPESKGIRKSLLNYGEYLPDIASCFSEGALSSAILN